MRSVSVEGKMRLVESFDAFSQSELRFSPSFHAAIGGVIHYKRMVLGKHRAGFAFIVRDRRIMARQRAERLSIKPEIHIFCREAQHAVRVRGQMLNIGNAEFFFQKIVCRIAFQLTVSGCIRLRHSSGCAGCGFQIFLVRDCFPDRQ